MPRSKVPAPKKGVIMLSIADPSTGEIEDIQTSGWTITAKDGSELQIFKYADKRHAIATKCGHVLFDMLATIRDCKRISNSYFDDELPVTLEGLNNAGHFENSDTIATFKNQLREIRDRLEQE